MTTKKLLSALLLAALLAACTPKPAGGICRQMAGDQGRADSRVRKKRGVVLFIDSDMKYPATLTKDNTMQLTAPKLGTVVFAYSKDSGTIVALGDEFKRVK